MVKIHTSEPDEFTRVIERNSANLFPPPVLHVPRRKHVANGFNFDRSTLESFAATRVSKLSSMFSNADALNFDISHREITCNDS